MTQKEKVIAYAKNEIGYAEEPKGSNKNKFAAMIDKDYPDFYNGKKNPCAWCDIFVDACFLSCFGEAEALRLLCQPKHSTGAGCKFSAQFYKDKKQFHNNPEAGDQIFFLDSKGVINHTGLVVKADDKRVYTVEGNSGDMVKAHSYALNNKSIAGYGRPAYNVESAAGGTIADTAPTAPAPVMPVNAEKPALLSDEEVAREIIAGKWGNGKKRETALTAAGYDYKKVQAIVNKLLSQPAQAPKPATFIGIVNTVSLPLRVRKGAGINYPVVRLLARGAKVELCSEAVSGFYKLADGSGYVAANLIKR